MSQTIPTPTSNRSGAPTIVVVVPKWDEFFEARLAFKISEQAEANETAAGVEYFETAVGDERIVLACLESQGNDDSQQITASLIAEFDPKLICMAGTALGSPASTIVDVYVASGVIKLTESRVTERGRTHQSVRTYASPPAVRRDVQDYIARGSYETQLNALLAERLRHEPADEPETFTVHAHSEVLGSGNEYHMTASGTDDMWLNFPQMRFYDMESLGFVFAAETTSTLWLIVRGVSDHGTKATKSDRHRKASSFTSAAFLSLFLAEGRRRSQPGRNHPPTIDADSLSEENIYVAESSSESSFRDRLVRDLGVHIHADLLDRALTAGDLEEVVVKAGASHEEARTFLPILREEYFRDKYIDYRYIDDRGKALDSRALAADWAPSIWDALRAWGFSSLVGKSVVDVGCGNGAELPELFADAPEAAELILVDVSKSMLEKAAARVPGPANVRTVAVPAEKLTGISDQSVDLYISLRTYQSRMFDFEASFREAFRVTKSGGVIAVSIANGYAVTTTDRHGNSVEAVALGLKASGMNRSLSREAPRRLAARVRKYYEKFSVECRLYELPHGEILLCGIMPDVYAPGYSGA